MDFRIAHATVINLVDTFAASHDKYLAPEYNESAVRKDFFDKYFIVNHVSLTATTIKYHIIPWVETHGYNQLTATRSRNKAAATAREREFWQGECDTLERTINEAVYKLYDLTADEIKLVETQ